MKILLALLVILTIPLVVLLLAPMSYLDLVERGIRSSTGLELRVADLEVDLFPPRIATRNLRLHNPHTDGGEPLLAVEHFSAAMHPGRYLKGTPAWWRAEAEGAVIRFSVDDSGRSNWYRPVDTNAGPGSRERDDRPMLVSGFESISISGFDVLRIKEGQTHRLRVSSLILAKEADERLRIKMDANYKDQPLSAAGILALPSSERARQIEFRASVFGSELRLDGTVGHDGITPGTAEFSASFTDLTTLGLWLDQDLSRYAPFTLTGTLQAPKPGRWLGNARGTLAGQTFSLNSAATVAGESYTLDNLEWVAGDSTVTANGTLDIADKSLTARISAPRIDTRQWPFAEIDSGSTTAEDPQRSTERFGFGQFEQWSVDMDVEVAELLYRGYRLNGLSLRANNTARELQLNARVQGITAAAGEDSGWQLVEPFTLDGTLDVTPEKRDAAAMLAVEFGSSGLEGELQASLPDALQEPAQIRLRTRLENLSAVQGVAEERWNAFLPLAVSVNAELASSTWQIDPISIRVSDNEIKGQLNVDRSVMPQKISGELHATLLDVNRFSTTPDPAASGSVEGATPEDSPRLFSDQALDWSWLEAADLDLSVHLDEFAFNQTRFRNVRAQLTLQEARFVIDPLDANLRKGGVRGHVGISRSGSGANIDTRLIVTELTPADLGQPDEGLIDGGETDLFLDMSASGASPRELAAALDGQVAVEIQRATVRNNLLEIIGSDIFTQTISLINPFSKQDDRTELECAAVHFEAADGVLVSRDQIVIETSKMKVRAGGEINLKDETLRLDFVPTARKGLGISAGDLAGVVRLGGTLSDPRPVADPKGILKTGATIGAAIATGGVSLLAEGLFNRARNRGTACGRIFEATTDVPEEIESSDPASQTAN